jgi:hypothetical protein
MAKSDKKGDKKVKSAPPKVDKKASPAKVAAKVKEVVVKPVVRSLLNIL